MQEEKLVLKSTMVSEVSTEILSAMRAEKQIPLISDRGMGIDITDAYKKARQSDPRSSFGDFIAVNRIVDESLAKVIKSCVSDGIIAPGYDRMAIKILSAKKGGNYPMIEMKNTEINSMTDFINEYKSIGNGIILL